MSPSLWGRANGWLAMALVDAYDILPEGHPALGEIRTRIVDLSAAVLKHRTADGAWLQVMDQPGLAGNYEEISASAMFAYAFLKAARLIPEMAPYAAHGADAIAALERHHMSRAGDTWQLDDICAVAGLGGNFGKPRDGSAHYYTTEPVVSNDPKGVGPLMMAVAELRAAKAAPDRTSASV